jgi:hypothetical protein
MLLFNIISDLFNLPKVFSPLGLILFTGTIFSKKKLWNLAKLPEPRYCAIDNPICRQLVIFSCLIHVEALLSLSITYSFR